MSFDLPRLSLVRNITLPFTLFAGLFLLVGHQAAYGAGVVPASLNGQYGDIPLSFEKNQGQTAPEVRFIARGSSSTLFLTCSQAVLELTKEKGLNSPPAAPDELQHARGAQVRHHVLRMSFGDAGRACRADGQELQPGRSHYFRGHSPHSWVTDVPTYAKVRYGEVYPGIDLVFYGNQKRIEYDFVVTPGADPSRIRLEIEGAESLEIDETGRLVASLGREQVIQYKPFIYQHGAVSETGVEAHKEAIRGGWKLLAENLVGFELSNYDRRRPLVIDPVIVYSTYLGGSETDRAYGIAVDHEGYAYIVGDTNSTDFPTTPGVPQPQYTGDSRDAFVTKLNPQGNQVIFSSYLSGTGPPQDRAFAVDVDPQGNVYVSGNTNSSDFPVTEGAFDTDPAGNTVFVTKLPPDGSRLIYSTFIGNGNEDSGGIVVDDDGFAYVAGQTNSTSFPLVNPIQAEKGDTRDAFIAKLNQEGSALVFSTYYGGATRPRSGIQAQDMAEAIALDEQGNIYVAGHTRAADFPTTPGAHKTAIAQDDFRDGFLLKLDPSGTRVIYSTLLGGTTNDWAYAVAVDFAGHAYVAGETNSDDFPVTPGGLREEGRSVEGYVTKFSQSGDSLVYSTFVGGSRTDEVQGIRVDTAGHAYVAGATNGLDGIETVNAIPGAEGSTGNTRSAAFFAKLRTDGSDALVFTGLGGDQIDRGEAIDVDLNCQAYLTGETRSADFVTVNPFQAESTADEGTPNGFVTKIDPSIETDEPTIGCRGVLEATLSPVLREGAANSIMTVFGKNFAPPGAQALQPEVDAGGRVTTRLADTCVEVNGIRVPIYAVLPNQVNFQNPHQIGAGYASFRVVSGCGAGNERISEPEHIRIREAAPAFFNFINNADGVNPIAALREDGMSFLGPPGIFGGAVETTPAEPGEFVSLFGTGFGATNPSFQAGQVPGMSAPLTTNDVQVTIGGIEVPSDDIFYIGIAPCCAGLYQLVVKIPPDAPNGSLPVVLTIQGRSSPEGPFVAVQAP